MIDFNNVSATTLPEGRGWRPAKFTRQNGGTITPMSDTVYLDRGYAREEAAKRIAFDAHYEASKHNAVMTVSAVISVGMLILMSISATMIVADFEPLILICCALAGLAAIMASLALFFSRSVRRLTKASEETASKMLLVEDPAFGTFDENSRRRRAT